MQEVSPDELRPNPWNPNKVDPINLEKLKTSMADDGLAKPILVREKDGGYEILDGQHRWQVAIDLEWPTVPIRNLGQISDAKAKKFTLIGNSRYGEDDQQALVELLTSEDFESAESLINTLPIDETELSTLFTNEDIDFSDLESELDDMDDGDGGVDLDVPTGSEKTHTILRFKVPIEDADRISGLIDDAKQSQGFTESDSLSNAGDALVYLLGDAS